MIKKILFLLIIFATTIQLNAQNYKTNKNKLERTLDLINTQYVENPDLDEITVAAIKAMMKKLDPHSKYLSKESLQKSRENLQGNFSGVGVHYQILDDTLFILKVEENGPAHQAGLKAADKLIKINDENCTGEKVSNKYFSKLLRGAKGSKVNVSVLRHDDKKIYNYEIERGSIPINSVIAYFMLDKNTGYIRINKFSNTTVSEFNEKLFLLKLQGMKSLVLDLRNNPGGLMYAAIELVDEFVNEESTIVYTQGEHYPKKEYKSSIKGNNKDVDLVVLVNENSASASEIVAGGLQDLDRALIVGRRTYGKGLVGRNFYLQDGSGIRLTTGRYYTPSGRCIQKSYENGVEEYKKELNKRLKHGEFVNPDSINFPDSLKYLTKNKRVVYGGGGIMPDIFIPVDTSENTPLFYKKLLRKGAINIFSVHYLDKNYEQITKKYKSYQDFKKKFKFDEELENALLEYVKNKYQIEATEKDFEESAEYIIPRFRAILSRNLFEGSMYFEETVKIDNEVNKALEIANDKNNFKLLKY